MLFNECCMNASFLRFGHQASPLVNTISVVQNAPRVDSHLVFFGSLAAAGGAGVLFID